MNKKYKAMFIMHRNQISAQILMHGYMNCMYRTSFFWSKEGGMKIIMSAFTKRKIVYDEKIELIHLLKKSPLPETEREGSELHQKFYGN